MIRLLQKNRDYRYDFDFSSNATTISTGPLCNSQYQPWEQAKGGGWPGGGRWRSDAIISVSRSAPVSSDGVACGAFIQALHFVGEGKRVRAYRRSTTAAHQNTAWSQWCADPQILGLLISASASVGSAARIQHLISVDGPRPQVNLINRTVDRPHP